MRSETREIHRPLGFRLFAGLVSLLSCLVSARGEPLTPADAVAKMKLPPGFSARCVASEPMIRQPLSISFDGTGRMWVLQYLQYPNPEGLKPVKQDQYLRTTWDKVLDPPPKGPKGLDKLTVCYDPDENGVFRKSKDFLTGLNVASGFCLANDGVYVVQPPYLLFYPDKDHDDKPDADPDVLLTGFGMDDTHSLANSLQFGPDGWLYGAAGSTSTCKILNPAGAKDDKPVEFQQGIWRYHPKTKRFELFSEGGGNTYGLDFDANGQCIAGTNWGGFACLHHLPGAYYVKGWSKHGPLHNPHAYGFFDHVPYKNFKGGHVTCGGVIYDADAYPKEYRGQYIAGNLLSNAVYTHKLTPKGASFTAEHGFDLLEANDGQFRPVDLQLGPDGCIYVADWYDKRAAHLDPVDNWDKTNGRVYRIEYTGYKPAKPFDVRKKTVGELVELLKHPNVWWRREARRELEGASFSESELAELLKLADDESVPVALEALWVITANVPRRGWPEWKAFAEHKNPQVRAWAVRAMGERPDRFTAKEWERLLKLLKDETDPVVRAQALCTVRRLNTDAGWRVLEVLGARNDLSSDPWLKQLYWWALQDTFPAEKSKFILHGEVSGDNALNEFVSERAIRRALTFDSGDNRAASLRAESQRYVGRRTVDVFARELEAAVAAGVEYDPRQMLNSLDDFRGGKLSEATVAAFERVRAMFGDKDSLNAVMAKATDDKLAVTDRVKAVATLGKVREQKAKVTADLWLMDQLEVAKADEMRTALIAAVESSGHKQAGKVICSCYEQWPAAVKKRALQALVSRKEWAAELFAKLDAGTFPKAEVTTDHARAALAFNDPALTKLVEKHFGKLAPTAGEKRARIDALNAMLGREKAGDPVKGKAVFTKACAACHQLFGEGGKVGPDLTATDRKNRGSLLASVVDPSGYIRPEFVTQTVSTTDGRTLTGVVTAQSETEITLATYADNKAASVTVPRKEIDKLSASGLSLMPEKLLDTMTEAEIRDLFAYLATDKANPDRKGGGEPKKLKLALISGSEEYESDKTLPILQKRLEADHPVECVRLFRKSDTDIPGLTDKLSECDAAVFFTRRLKIDGDQLKAVKAFCDSGKPILGIRTASHGFQTWLEQDKEVYGGNYKNHFKATDKWELKTTTDGDKHPILKGVKVWASEASLYRNTGAAKDITVLMTGTMKEDSEPITWVREREVGEKKAKQRVFYTSLGHQKDFEEENFLKLMSNAYGWAVAK